MRAQLVHEARAAVAAGQVVLERASLGVGQQPGELIARGVHRGLAGELLHDIACSASLTWVQTFMLMARSLVVTPRMLIVRCVIGDALRSLGTLENTRRRERPTCSIREFARPHISQVTA